MRFITPSPTLPLKEKGATPLFRNGEGLGVR